MFKKVFVFCTFLCLSFLGFALESVSGDYVIYEDKSFTQETWIGFLYYNQSTYGAVLYTPSANRRISILFSVKTNSGKMELTGQRIIGKIDMKSKQDIEAVNYLMQLLPELYAWGKKGKPKKSKLISRNSCAVKNIAILGGNIEVKTTSYVPLFGIEKVRNEKQTLLSLSRIGRVVVKDEEFFNFVLPFETRRPAVLTLDRSAKAKLKKYGPLRILLDSQWTEIAENMYFLGSSAFLTLSQIDIADFEGHSELVRFFSLSTNERIIDMKNIYVLGGGDKLTIVNKVYDCETQRVNIDKKMILLHDNSYILASLTVACSDYEKYKSYFDDLF